MGLARSTLAASLLAFVEVFFALRKDDEALADLRLAPAFKHLASVNPRVALAFERLARLDRVLALLDPLLGRSEDAGAPTFPVLRNSERP